MTSIRILRCSGLQDEDPFGGNDPYVVVEEIGNKNDDNKELYRTPVKEEVADGVAVTWKNAICDIDTATTKKIQLKVWDKDVTNDDLLGVSEDLSIPEFSTTEEGHPNDGETALALRKDGEAAGRVVIQWEGLPRRPEKEEKKPAEEEEEETVKVQDEKKHAPSPPPKKTPPTTKKVAPKKKVVQSESPSSHSPTTEDVAMTLPGHRTKINLSDLHRHQQKYPLYSPTSGPHMLQHPPLRSQRSRASNNSSQNGKTDGDEGETGSSSGAGSSSLPPIQSRSGATAKQLANDLDAMKEKQAVYCDRSNPLVVSSAPSTTSKPPRCYLECGLFSPMKMAEEMEEQQQSEDNNGSPTESTGGGRAGGSSPTRRNKKAEQRAAEIALENEERLMQFNEECKYLRARFMFDRSKKVAERRIYASIITKNWRQHTKKNAYRVNQVKDAKKVIKQAEEQAELRKKQQAEADDGADADVGGDPYLGRSLSPTDDGALSSSQPSTSAGTPRSARRNGSGTRLTTEQRQRRAKKYRDQQKEKHQRVMGDRYEERKAHHQQRMLEEADMQEDRSRSTSPTPRNNVVESDFMTTKSPRNGRKQQVTKRQKFFPNSTREHPLAPFPPSPPLKTVDTKMKDRSYSLLQQRAVRLVPGEVAATKRILTQEEAEYVNTPYSKKDITATVVKKPHKAGAPAPRPPQSPSTSKTHTRRHTQNDSTTTADAEPTPQDTTVNDTDQSQPDEKAPVQKDDDDPATAEDVEAPNDETTSTPS